MFLKKGEEEALEGQHGRVLQWAFSILYEDGKRNHAESLVPVQSVHIPVNSSSKFDVDLESPGETNFFIPELPVSSNPLCSQGLFPGVFLFNLRRHGCRDIHTCTPYLCGNTPSKDSICAWGGRSAVTMLNSVIGARSNPQNFHTALASAITGKTALYGLLTDEARKPLMCIELDRDVKIDPSILGQYLAQELKGATPLIRGWHYGFDEAKKFSACFNHLGKQPLFLLKDSDPCSNLEVFPIDLHKIMGLHDSQIIEPDMIIFGCPHLSEQQINQLAKTLTEKPRNQTELKFFTSRLCLDKCPKSGALLSRRGTIYIDCCPSSLTDEFEGKTIFTDNLTLKECLSQKGYDVNFAPFRMLEKYLDGTMHNE